MIWWPVRGSLQFVSRGLLHAVLGMRELRVSLFARLIVVIDGWGALRGELILALVRLSPPARAVIDDDTDPH